MTDFTLAPMGRVELDKLIIDTGNAIASIGYSSTTAGPVKDQYDWSFRWIDRRGMGNHGTLIAVPKSSRAKGVWRQAMLHKVAKLTEDDFAKKYLPATKGVPCSLEDKVIDFVYEHGHMLITSEPPVSWRQIKLNLGEEVVDLAKEKGLSFWRLKAAIEVSNKLY